MEYPLKIRIESAYQFRPLGSGFVNPDRAGRARQIVKRNVNPDEGGLCCHAGRAMNCTTTNRRQNNYELVNHLQTFCGLFLMTAVWQRGFLWLIPCCYTEL